MTVETFPRPEQQGPPRDRWERPLVVPPGGGKPTAYTRCTTFVGSLDDTFKLGQWQQRHAIRGTALHDDLIAAIRDVDPDDKTRLNELADEAKNRSGAGDAALIGTYLHAVTEAVDRGQDPALVDTPMLSTGRLDPDVYRPDVAAYQRVTEPLTAVHIERFTVEDELRIGGTPDRVVTYDGRTYIADLKSGSIEWSALKIAMQLAVYAHSSLYDVPTGARSPLLDVDQDRAIVVHLPAGTGECELHWIDIAAGWEAVQVAAEVRKWRKRGRRMLSNLLPTQQLALDVAPTPTPAPEPVAEVGPDLPNLIASAPTDAALGDLWRAHRDQWTPELTALASARKRLLAEAG